MDISSETLFRSIGSIIGLAFAAILSYFFFTRYLQRQEKKVVKGNYTSFVKLYPSFHATAEQGIEALNEFVTGQSDRVECLKTVTNVSKKLHQISEEAIPAYIYKHFLELKKTLNNAAMEMTNDIPNNQKIQAFEKVLRTSFDKIEEFAKKIKK